jgi:hypothetical protein
MSLVFAPVATRYFSLGIIVPLSAAESLQVSGQLHFQFYRYTVYICRREIPYDNLRELYGEK